MAWLGRRRVHPCSRVSRLVSMGNPVAVRPDAYPYSGKDGVSVCVQRKTFSLYTVVLRTALCVSVDHVVVLSVIAGLDWV